jgi:hypothetical protein
MYNLRTCFTRKSLENLTFRPWVRGVMFLPFPPGGDLGARWEKKDGNAWMLTISYSSARCSVLLRRIAPVADRLCARTPTRFPTCSPDLLVVVVVTWRQHRAQS